MLTANLPVAVNDSFQVAPDTTFNAPTSVLANDFDLDGDNVDQVVLNGNVSHGSLSLASDGTFSYTPATGFSGVDSFSYFARDSADSENSANPATVTLNVGSANNAPVAQPLTINVAADTQFIGGLSGTDSDNDPLTFSVGSIQPSHGAVTVNLDGSFTYSPGSGYIGPDSFTFKVNDGTTNSADARVTVNVGSAANHAPTATSISINVATNTQFAGALSGNDVDGDPLTFAQGDTLAAHGTVSITTNGNFTYTPNVGYTGADSFSFSVSDGTFSSTNDGIVSVQVANPIGGNTAPVANPTSIHVGLNTTFLGGLSGSDADGDSLTFSTGSIAAQHGSVGISSNGNFSYTPNTGYTGSDSFSFKVNDGTANSADALVSVQVGGTTNHPPVAAPVTINDVPGNAPFNGTLQASDADGDVLTFSAGSTQPAHGTVNINSNGSFTYTPNNGFVGTDSFSFKVNDGTVNSADALVTLHIGGASNTPPVATPVSINVGLNTTFSGGLSGTDADGDPLTFSAGSTTAAHGTVNITSNGSFTYTPNTNYTGSDSFSFKVNDGTANSADALVSVQVGTASNTPPVANPTSINVAFNTTFVGGLSGSDVDGDLLTFSAGSTAAAHGVVNINANGTFTYTPNSGYSGSDSFSFKVNDGTTNSTDALVSVQVGTSTNTPPVAHPIGITVSMNTTFAGGLTGSDADGDPLTFLAGNTAPSHGTVHINTNGSFTYTPNTGYVGSDSFSFKVDDGTVSSSNALVSIQVVATGGNSAPVATPVSINVGMNTTFSGFLSATDANGDPLTFALGTTHPAHGTVNINSNGSFSYTPNANYTGSDAFSFRVNDGTVNSADALVSIQVGTASNTPPTANSTSISVALNTVFIGTLSGSDVDGDPLTFSAGSTAAAHGNLLINSDGSFIYNPAPGYTGSDIFSFKVNDGTANSADAFVFVTVGSATNTPPVANSANINVTLNATFHGALSATDADNDFLTFSAGSIAAAHGTVLINTNGTFTYVPDTDFVGSDEFSFKVNDGTVDSAEALISVTVGSGSNTPPVAHPVTVSTPEGVTLTGTLSGSDVDGDPLTFSAGSTSPAHGSVTVNENGTFTYTPNAGFVGFDLFTFKVNDGTVDSASGNVIIHITGTSGGAPTVINGSGNVITNVTFDGSVSPLAVDPEGDPLTFSVVAQPLHGSLSLNPDGTFAYTPDTDYVGLDSFTFKANDGLLDSNVGIFNLNVSDVSGGFTLVLSDNPGTIETSLRSVTPLDTSASLINVDPSVSFANAAVTARITSGGSSQDRFVLTDGGSVEIRGRKVRVNGTEVARISGGRGGQALEIAFNSSATTDSVQAVIQRIGLKTSRRSGNDPRVVQITVNADGFSSSALIVANKA